MVELTDFYNYMDQNTKPWYKSWTIWINVLLAIVDFANALAQIVPIPPGFLTMLGALVNIILRFQTSKAIQ